MFLFFYQKKVILSCFAGCSRFWLRRRSATSDSLAPKEKEETLLTKKGFSLKEEEEEETRRRAKTKKKTEEEEADFSRFVTNDTKTIFKAISSSEWHRDFVFL